MENEFFRATQDSLYLQKIFSFDTYDKPFRNLHVTKDFAKYPQDFDSDNFKGTASFKEFLNNEFDYPNAILYEILFNEKCVIIQNQIIIVNQRIEVHKMFKQFFLRNLEMENGAWYEPWRRDVIRSQCNHSFLKQLPRYPTDDYWRYEHLHVMS